MITIAECPCILLDALEMAPGWNTYSFVIILKENYNSGTCISM